ncbi:Synergin gamma [Bienertia sinuspersici]
MELKLKLQKECPRNVDKRHKAQFPKWILECVCFILLGNVEEESLSSSISDFCIDSLATNAFMVEREANAVEMIVTKRNSKNRLYDKMVIHTTGNLAFAEVEDILTKENNNVKPSVNVVWLIEHTCNYKKGELEWANATRSKTIHDKLKNVVAEDGDTMTQEEILIQLIELRSGYIRGKGTTLCGYVRGKQQLEQRKLVEEQQGKIKEQERRINELQESQERQQREFEEHKVKQEANMEAFKQDLLR